MKRGFLYQLTLVVAIPSISYGILKMIKLGIKRWKAKLWLKLLLFKYRSGLNIHEYNAYPYLNNNKVWSLGGKYS
jgi:hypothetical protein